MTIEKNIRLENLPLFVRCFSWDFYNGRTLLLKGCEEIDGEIYTSVEYDPDFFDERKYQESRSRG